jgi:hypothetical protein
LPANNGIGIVETVRENLIYKINFEKGIIKKK